MTRRTRLVDCNPQWVKEHSEADQHGAIHFLRFDCPEGHADCWHVIPFSPRLDGTPYDSKERPIWTRVGDTFGTLTMSPSIRRNPHYANREDAIKAGCIPEHVTDSLLCALHIFIQDGGIVFCGDSR